MIMVVLAVEINVYFLLKEDDMRIILLKFYGTACAIFSVLTLNFLIAAAPDAPANLIEITSQAQYEQLIKSGKQTVLEFYANWCGACNKAKGKVKEFAQKNSHVNFLLINVDSSISSAFRAGVTAYPTFVILGADGAKKGASVGYNEGQIKDLLSKDSNVKMAAAEVKKNDKIVAQPIKEQKEEIKPVQPKQLTQETKPSTAPSKQQSSLIELRDEAHLKELKNKKQAILLDFYTVWCGPCKVVKPELEKLAPEYPDVLFICVDAEGRNTAALAGDAHYKVNGYPTLVVIGKDGKEVGRLTGCHSDNVLLKNMLNQASGKQGGTRIIKKESQVVCGK